jgi:hypothetical protein
MPVGAGWTFGEGCMVTKCAAFSTWAWPACDCGSVLRQQLRDPSCARRANVTHPSARPEGVRRSHDGRDHTRLHWPRGGGGCTRLHWQRGRQIGGPGAGGRSSSRTSRGVPSTVLSATTVPSCTSDRDSSGQPHRVEQWRRTLASDVPGRTLKSSSLPCRDANVQKKGQLAVMALRDCQ